MASRTGLPRARVQALGSSEGPRGGAVRRLYRRLRGLRPAPRTGASRPRPLRALARRKAGTACNRTSGRQAFRSALLAPSRVAGRNGSNQVEHGVSEHSRARDDLCDRLSSRGPVADLPPRRHRRILDGREGCGPSLRGSFGGADAPCVRDRRHDRGDPHKVGWIRRGRSRLRPARTHGGLEKYEDSSCILRSSGRGVRQTGLACARRAGLSIPSLVGRRDRTSPSRSPLPPSRLPLPRCPRRPPPMSVRGPGHPRPVRAVPGFLAGSRLVEEQEDLSFVPQLHDMPMSPPRLFVDKNGV